jgi:hypothetical protein
MAHISPTETANSTRSVIGGVQRPTVATIGRHRANIHIQIHNRELFAGSSLWFIVAEFVADQSPTWSFEHGKRILGEATPSETVKLIDKVQA